MGLLDRDWYWKHRAQRNSPDDDYLFPDRPSPGRKSVFFPIALAVLALLALLVFVLNQGGFDTRARDTRSRAEQLAAEERALRVDGQQRYPNGQPAAEPRVRRGPDIQTRQMEEDRERAGRRDVTIEFAILLGALPSPIVFLALLVMLFIRPARRPACAGLVFGLVGGFAGAIIMQQLHLAHREPPGLGAMLQSLSEVACFFTLTAITATIVAIVLSKPDPAPSPAAASTKVPDDSSV